MPRFRATTIFIAVVALATFLASCGAEKGPRSARDSGRYIRDHHLSELPKFDVPVEVNDRVVAWMEYFQGPGRDHFQRYLERSGRYIPMMTKILKDQGMPQDLVYVALIESGFNTSAYSRAAAVGPWQFISGTGRRYGMRNDGWVDERRDPIRSTYAAAQYLKELYNEFGDWYLAMAGYNAGEGRIRNAIASTGSKNFWTIAADRRALRPETRDYVPKFIAAAIMAKSPERFGFTNVAYQPPLDFDTANVESQTDIPVIAKCTGVDEQTISDLNPHLVRGATPAGERNYEVRLPRGSSIKFREEYAKLPEEERIKVVRYEAKPRDTIVKIAHRFGVSAAHLAEVNGINMRAKLRRGQMIVVPASAAARFAKASDEGSGSRGGHTSKYRVRKGDSLQSIANRHGVTVAQLRKWNDISRSTKVKRGQVLRINKKSAAIAARTTAIPLDSAEPKNTENNNEQTAGTETAKSAPAIVSQKHQVRAGEKIGTIAAKYGVTTKQLMAWNNIKDARRIRAGQMLIIRNQKIQAQPDKTVETQASTLKKPAHTPIKIDAMRGSLPKKQEKEPLKQSLVDMPKVEGVSDAEPASTPIKLSEGIKLAAPKPVSALQEQQSTTYRVRNGETLWEIARRNKVSIAQLQKWNNLKDPSSVKPGATLKIIK